MINVQHYKSAAAPRRVRRSTSTTQGHTMQPSASHQRHLRALEAHLRPHARLAGGTSAQPGRWRPKSGCATVVASSPAALDGPPVLTAADHEFFREKGYVIIHDAVEEPVVDAVVDDLWSHLDMARDDSATWYTPVERAGAATWDGGMVELYQQQSLWDVRQHPRVYRAFAELWGTEELWVTFDRVHMKPPVAPDKGQAWGEEGALHWDLPADMLLSGGDPAENLMLQGVLYLADTSDTGGSFQCVPGFHNEFASWAVRETHIFCAIFYSK
jgi:hypothetical protein